MEDELIKERTNKKTEIITNNDENNINYYKELNSREPRSFIQSIDYYDLLKQQIKYYKELNASLKEEIETVKKSKKIKQLEELNEINKLASIRREKEDINSLLSSINYDAQIKMRKGLNENELKISDLETRNRKLEESTIKLKNTLVKANDIFPNFLEKTKNYPEGGETRDLDIQFSSNFGDSKNSQNKQANIQFWNNCCDEKCILVKKELKRLENENECLKNRVIQLNQTIKNMKLNKNEINKIKINENNNINNEEYSINENDISKSSDDFINNNINQFKEKIILDNKRLNIYINSL